MDNIFGTNRCIQVCVAVQDVEEKKRKWAQFLGMEVPPTTNAGPYAITGCEYKGKAEQRANCLMGAFQLNETLMLEVLQPTGGVPSEWQDFVDEYGKGLHHLAFGVKSIPEVLQKAGAQFGWACTQQGKFNDGMGAYAYLDTRAGLNATVELLEVYEGGQYENWINGS